MAEVTVHDNGDGIMYTVTKALKKDGNDEESVASKPRSYKAPTHRFR